MSSNGWKNSERELRFLLSRPQAEQFLTRAATRLVLADHHRDSPVAYTRTTYFDSDDFVHFRSCTSHEPEIVARRVRIREYAAAPDLNAPPLLTGHCFLELKESRGSARRKVRFAAPPERIWQIAASGASRGPRDAEDVSDDPLLRSVEHHMRTGHLRPCLTTWYRRWSFFAREEPIRITFDEGLAYCRVPVCARNPEASPCRQGQTAEPAEVIAFGPGRVIEVKYHGLPPAWLVDSIADLPTRTRSSKFPMGMRALRRVGEAGSRGAATRPLTLPGRFPIPAA